MCEYSTAHLDGRSISCSWMGGLLMLEISEDSAGGYGDYGGGSLPEDINLDDYSDYCPKALISMIIFHSKTNYPNPK